MSGGPEKFQYDGPAVFSGGFLAIDPHQDLRTGVRDLCKSFPDTYWRELDSRREKAREVRNAEAAP
jgi:hypothetical protein